MSKWIGHRVRLKGYHSKAGQCGAIAGRWPVEQDGAWEVNLDDGTRTIARKGQLESETTPQEGSAVKGAS